LLLSGDVSWSGGYLLSFISFRRPVCAVATANYRSVHDHVHDSHGVLEILESAIAVRAG
jgi:hypothetical protein